MKKATLDQGMKILELFSEVPCEQVQSLLSSGLLADLRDGNIARVDRNAFREMVGLVPFNLPLLVPIEQVPVGPLAGGPTRKYYTTKKGLYIWGTFVDWVLPAVGDTVSLTERIDLPSFRLTEPANDATIRENLPESHVFEADELCVILAHLIDCQPNGKEGVLNTNGYANLFYFEGKDGEVYVVLVYWNAGYREWYVDAWSLDDFTWGAEYRIPSRNC